jgi:hydroxymethylglutaryl-CoA reductase
MVVTHIIVDARDAMGANTVNTMAERLAPHIEGWTEGKVFLKILSNLADRRLARAREV